MRGVTVLVCDAHRMFAEALSLVLARQGAVVVGSACGLDSACELATAHRPGIALVGQPCGPDSTLDVANAILLESPLTAVVVLTGDETAPHLADLAAAGVRAVAHKHGPLNQVVDVLRNVSAGSHPALVRYLPTAAASLAARRFGLTPREFEVLELLGQGISTQELAARLGMRYSTARSHIQTVLGKLGAHSQVEAVAIARRQRLLASPSRIVEPA
jgi:DNA-binding NarL/FixJ family response regulator